MNTVYIELLYSPKRLYRAHVKCKKENVLGTNKRFCTFVKISQSTTRIVCHRSHGLQVSHLMVKPTMWFLNRSDTNWSVSSKTLVKSLKFWIWKVEELYYPYNENKGADQLRGYREADLRLCFRLCRLLVFQ